MSKISNVRLPNASVSYDSSQFNQLVRSLEQIILELNTAYSSIGTENKDAALTWYESSSGPLPDPVYYGNFARTTSYAPAVADTAYAVPFDSTIISDGVSVGTPTSRIVVVESGFYSVSCTLQYSSSNASAKTTYTWIRKNGVDVAQSSRLVSLDSNGGYQLGVVSESISLGAGDYIEIMVAVTDIAATLAAVGATAFAPGSPAANLTIQQIQQ
jgi:hypothetical protein